MTRSGEEISPRRHGDTEGLKSRPRRVVIALGIASILVLPASLALLLETSTWMQESLCLLKLQVVSDWRPIVTELARLKSRRGVHYFYFEIAERASADGTFPRGMSKRDSQMVESCGFALAEMKAELGKAEFEKICRSLLEDPAIDETEKKQIRSE